tara:strand:- start:35 stop:283 length:249 start_codon:yes stop_codon:yes gene_type:complete
VLPIPWEIIKAGGTINDNGLIVVKEVIFENCTINKREIIKIICLEVIVGFSFLEINIKIPQLNKTSVKVKNKDKVSEVFKED